MMEMPRATNISSLVETTGKSPRLIRSILSTLSQNGLVGRDSKEKDAWHCRDCSSIFTLADVYRCFVEAKNALCKGAENEVALPETACALP
jgi:DNA-binding IscR family transcriptional regulator